nr:hypothetical protein Iba_chr06bCG0240 [Ipomoea batatas]
MLYPFQVPISLESKMLRYRSLNTLPVPATTHVSLHLQHLQALHSRIPSKNMLFTPAYSLMATKNLTSSVKDFCLFCLKSYVHVC